MSDIQREKILKRLALILGNINPHKTIEPCEVVANWDHAVLGVGIQAVRNSTDKKEGQYSLDLGKSAGGTQAYYVHNVSGGIPYYCSDQQKLGVWVRVKDKTVLGTSVAIGLLIGHSAADLYQYLVPQADLQDIDNDATDGWNLLTPAILSDFGQAAGYVDISKLDYLILLIQTASADTVLASGDIGMDDWHLIFPCFNTGVEKVYRYSKGMTQLPITPSIVMSAIDEDNEQKVYPTISGKLTVGLDTHIELGEDDILDQKLNVVDGDIQHAIAMCNTQLGGLAQYVKIVRRSVSVLENHGILTTMLEIDYLMDYTNAIKGA